MAPMGVGDARAKFDEAACEMLLPAIVTPNAVTGGLVGFHAFE
jgi:hypothetical protein